MRCLTLIFPLLMLSVLASAQPEWQKAVNRHFDQVCQRGEAVRNMNKGPRWCDFLSEDDFKNAGVTNDMLSSPYLSVMPTGRSLPVELPRSGGSVRALAVAHPTCSNGRALVRTVFKVTQSPTKTSRASGVQLSPYNLARASPIVRCYLQLDPKSAPKEQDQALHAAEKRCYICFDTTDDSKGCPSELNAWFSDTLTISVQGCEPDGLGSWKVRFPVWVKAVVSTGWKALFAKFEVCKTSDCFNADYEARKLREAKQCTAMDC